MFDKEALKNTMSTNTLAVKQAILPKKPKKHSIGTILRRTQVPGVPTTMKPVGKDGPMTARIKKTYGIESIDIKRILETSLNSTIISDRAQHRRAIQRARALINNRTSITSKLSNTRKSISGKPPERIFAPHHSPNEPMIDKNKIPNWSTKG